MYATQLIGKKAIRTKPCSLSIKGEDDSPSMGFMGIMAGTQTGTRYDYSYTDEPLIILAATESHIIIKYPDDSLLSRMGGGKDKPHILNCRWCDDNWADYDELMKLAEPAIQELVNESMKAAGNEDAR
jgi:hypothetical protein